MRVSKFVKPNKDILIEYIYDDGNNISEGYRLLQNVRDNSLSYVGAESSITNNEQSNQLVQLDAVTNNFGLLNTNTYGFLQLRDFSSGFPNRHDIIKVHLPVNYTFGEYLGFYLKVFTFDFDNQKVVTLSNFYFDISNLDQTQLLNFNSPAFLFQEKLWGKNITLMVPSTYAIARQRVGDAPKENSINSNLTNRAGLSLTSPVFLDFHFIAQKRTVNSLVTYNLTPKVSISLPQAPDFENIGVKIQHSQNGDYFEIFGTFNGDINQFDNFIQNAVSIGNRYYVTYTITLFEQNIRGKSFTITVTDNFAERIEYRPIIKFSTTTAIIDVEMNMIDAVDESSIYRKSSYGMLQDEVSKYSLNLTKINIANAAKPKIYNIKSPEGAGIFGNQNTRGRINSGLPGSKFKGENGLSVGINQVYLEPIKVNYAVLTNMYTVVAKSDNVIVGKDTFYGLGKLELLIQPFDNIIKLKIARDVTQITLATTVTTPSQVSAQTEYLDMTNMGEIKFVIKNPQILFETTLLISSNEVDLANGIVVFKIPASKIPDIKKVSESGFNVFYVTSSTDAGTTVVYSGIYSIYDSIENIRNLRSQAEAAQSDAARAESQIIDDPELANRRTPGIATVTLSQNGSNNIGATNSEVTQSTSVESSTKFGNNTYTIDSKSNLIVNGYLWTNSQIKDVLALTTPPIQLTFKSDGLYSFNKFLSKLVDLNEALKRKYIKIETDRELLESTQNAFRDEQSS